MELIAILLSGITALFSFSGVVVDKNVEAALLARIDHAEQLEVRADNAPNYQVINGKIDKVRIAGRGLWVTKDLRIDTLDLETDPIAVKLKDVQADDNIPSASSLQQPIQAAVKFKFNEADLNNFLKSPDAIARLQRITTSTLGGAASSSLNKDYQVTNPQIRFIGKDRLGIKAQLKDPGSGETLAIDLETGIRIDGGRKLQLLQPNATVDGTQVPPFILTGLATGLSERLNVDMLAQRGLTARILQFKVNPQQLELAAFVKATGSKEAAAPTQK
jgi:LmeA-like phospholipid-binding